MTKGVFSKVIVFLVIVLNVMFASRVLEVYAEIGTEPTTLIVTWFSFTTGELLLIAGIKKAKLSVKEKKEPEENDERNDCED